MTTPSPRAVEAAKQICLSRVFETHVDEPASKFAAEIIQSAITAAVAEATRELQLALCKLNSGTELQEMLQRWNEACAEISRLMELTQELTVERDGLSEGLKGRLSERDAFARERDSLRAEHDALRKATRAMDEALQKTVFDTIAGIKGGDRATLEFVTTQLRAVLSPTAAQEKPSWSTDKQTDTLEQPVATEGREEKHSTRVTGRRYESVDALVAAECSPEFQALYHETSAPQPPHPDTVRLDWLETERPNIMCLCTWNGFTFMPDSLETKPDGFVWVIRDLVARHPTLRSAIDAAQKGEG